MLKSLNKFVNFFKPMGVTVTESTIRSMRSMTSVASTKFEPFNEVKIVDNFDDRANDHTVIEIPSDVSNVSNPSLDIPSEDDHGYMIESTLQYIHGPDIWDY